MNKQEWENQNKRKNKESELIDTDFNLTYNKLIDDSRALELNPFFDKKHTEQAKKKIGDTMRGIPKDNLGRKIIISGVPYPSIAEASRVTGFARKTIRKKVNDPNTTAPLKFLSGKRIKLLDKV